MGVFFEYSDYHKYVNQLDEYTSVPPPYIPSLITLAYACGCLGFFLVLNNYFWVEYIYSSDFGNDSFAYKLYYIYVAMTVKRFFYYGPFKFTTGAFQATGLGYNGHNPNKPELEWSKVEGAFIWDIESANSVTIMLRAWNHQVHLWLKFYILARIQQGDRPSFFESMSTFVVSAFWHGFYPSYYIMFMIAAVLQEVNKDVYKSWALWYKLIPVKQVRFGLSFFFGFCCMNYLGILF